MRPNYSRALLQSIGVHPVPRLCDVTRPRSVVDADIRDVYRLPLRERHHQHGVVVGVLWVISWNEHVQSRPTRFAIGRSRRRLQREPELSIGCNLNTLNWGANIGSGVRALEEGAQDG